MNLTILFVIDGLGPGGAERSLAETLRYLHQANIRSIVAFFNRRQENLEGLLQENGADLRFIPQRTVAGRLSALRQLIQAERPDVIHTTLFESDIIGRLASIGQGAAVVTSLVNTTYDPIRLQDAHVNALKLGLVRLIDGWTARHLTTHFHAITRAVRQSAIESMNLAPDRITVIERGRDGYGQCPTDADRASARQKLGLSESDELILNVGRQEYQKGQRYLLEAMETILRVRPRAVLLIAGRKGHQSPMLDALATRIPDGRVRLLGHRDDVADLLAAADLFVFPSLYEGLGGSLIEAMASGLPIVASRLPAIEEVVEDGRNALLVERGSIAPLATAVTDLLENPDRARTFGVRSRDLRVEIHPGSPRDANGRLLSSYRRAHRRSHRDPPGVRGAVQVKRKVLVLIKGLGLGGAERLLIDSLPFMNRAQFDYHVGYLLPWKGLLANELEAAGIPVHCLGVSGTDAASPGSWAALSLLPGALRRLLALQRRERFDLIQADLPVAGIVARLLGKWTATPVVYTEHNVQERYHAITRWANAVTYGWNRRVVAVSAEVAASIARVRLLPESLVVTLPNGVPVESVRSEGALIGDVRGELNIPQRNLVVGTVAVFRSQKRLDDWLQVAAQVVRQRADVTFLLVGSGPQEPAVSARIEALGLTHRIRTPGFRRDGRRMMSAMDVYLMTSEFEGLPMALLEAMTLGKPVVSTAVGGVPEVLASSGAGFLAPVGAIDTLTSHLIRLLDDADLRSRMGAAGADRVESHYHVKRRVEALEHLYHEVLQDAA